MKGLPPDAMKMLQNIPPEAMQQMMQRMPNLPPGAQLPPGMQMPAPQRTAPAPPSRKTHNPLPPGQSALKIMKGFAQCPMMEDSDIIQKLLDRVLSLEEGAEFTELTDLAGSAIATLLRSELACNKQIKRRVAVRFADDPDLNKTHEDLLEAQAKVEKLQKDVTEAIQQMHAAIKKRWDTAVDNFGLNPEAHFYAIDEEQGLIELVDLDCNSCKGKTIVRKKRQEMAQTILDVGKKKAEEEKNDRARATTGGDEASEGHAESSGEVSDEQQEVQSVADSANSNGRDGNNGPDNST